VAMVNEDIGRRGGGAFEDCDGRAGRDREIDARAEAGAATVAPHH
jgi:hypothetical protein